MGRLTPVRSTQSLAVRVVAYGFLAAVFYVAGTLLLFLFAVLSLGRGRVHTNEVLVKYEWAAYMGGLRRIWETEPGCAEFDPDLLYRPAPAPASSQTPNSRPC